MLKSKMLYKIIFIISITASLNAEIYFSQSIFFSANSDKETSIGYKPEFQYNKTILKKHSLDFMTSLDFKIAKEQTTYSLHSSIYRLWLRYSTDFFETRIGNQKINFGPAKILRSLRWFDTIDPLDPKGESEGVSSILTRYYFLNNSTLWVWGILGNENIKGDETIGSKQNCEPGLRFQFPIKSSEVAFSYHNRKRLDDLTENRFGFDLFCDFYIGMWAEFCIINISDKNDYQFTSGADYTFPILSGIHLLLENRTSWNKEYSANDSAIIINIPLSILDNISASKSFNFRHEISSTSLAWQRTYDQFSLNISTILISNKNVTKKEAKLLLAYDF